MILYVDQNVTTIRLAMDTLWIHLVAYAPLADAIPLLTLLGVSGVHFQINLHPLVV